MSENHNLPVSVWLTASKTYVLHCMICGNSLGLKVDSQPTLINIGLDISKSDTKALDLPMRIACQNRHAVHGKCPGYYIFQGFIYPSKDED
jgi:hypothetical protein